MPKLKLTAVAVDAVCTLILGAAAGCATPPVRFSDASTSHEAGGAHERAVVHQIAASEQGILVNAYLVESATAVVCVDSALTVSDAEQLRKRLDAIGKPLVAVLLTHGHPDHYNGVHALLEGRAAVPVYATAAVDEVIRASDAAKEAQWKPMFGDEWPDTRSFPTHLMQDGERLQLDGNTWTVHALGPGESHADSYWQLSADGTHYFVGDVVMHDVHAYTTDGHTAAWIEHLSQLKTALPETAMLYPGHGSPGSQELLALQLDYLETYRGTVEELREGAPQLSDDARAMLNARMTQRYPGYALEFLIGLGADAVARELDEADGAD